MSIQVVAWLGIVLAAGALAAQDLELPPGRWWEDPRLAERLALGAAQQAEVREVVTEHARRMIDLKAEVERAGLELAEAARRDDFEPAAVRASFAAFQSARARLESERFEMLLAVRGLLSTEQWRTLQELRRRFRGPRDEAAPGPRRAPGSGPPI